MEEAVGNLEETLPLHTEINMLVVGRHPKFSQFVVKREGKGAVPDELSGMYTDTRLAQMSIDKYNEAQEQANAKAEAAEKKHEEALKKPLGHTQRKKPNAKKQSTSRK